MDIWNFFKRKITNTDDDTSANKKYKISGVIYYYWWRFFRVAIDFEWKFRLLQNCFTSGRANYNTDSIENYFGTFIPYLDHFILSLTTWFSETKVSSYSLFSLHPKNVHNLKPSCFKGLGEFYSTDNLSDEIQNWQDFVKIKKLDSSIWERERES